MDYTIKNNRDIFIRLDKDGRPVTCPKQDMMAFEYSKAKNICDHLPKTMKRLHFKVEAIPEIKQKKEVEIDEIIEDKPKLLENQDYIPSENITRWIDKFGTCGDILNEAEEREVQLFKDLDDADNELLDILHIIEMEKPKDLFGGWKLYKRIKDNRKRRRDIKDEILIVENVLDKIKDVSALHREKVQKAIDGLFKRKYRFRIVEEEE